MDYLKIKKKITSAQLSALGGYERFEHLSEYEAYRLINCCGEDSAPDCDENELQRFIEILSEASNSLMLRSSVNGSPTFSPIKASLLEKAEALQIFLNRSSPDWRTKMCSFFSGSVLRIIKLIFGATYLDCSVLYHLDQIIDEETVKRYNKYILLLFGVHPFKGNLQNRSFYHRFYSFDYKQSNPKYSKQLEKLRSISDFKRAKIKVNYFDLILNYEAFPLLYEAQSLELQSARLNINYNTISLLVCDYHVCSYFGVYFSVLNRLIPDEESFNKAAADGFFFWSDVDWEGFRYFMRFADDGIYCQDFYSFIEEANKRFYNYSGASFRDLREKMLFEP